MQEPWSETKRTWLAAASRVGKLIGQHHIFIPELDPQYEHVIRFKVKIVHAKTQWSEGRLFFRHAPEPVSIVADGKSRTLTRLEQRKRRGWTRIDGPVWDII